MQEKLDALVRTQAMQLFRQQGLHFTMQQVAEPLHISKKTIYTVYPSKETLLLDMVDHAFADIHRCKQEILAGSGLAHMVTRPKASVYKKLGLPDDYHDAIGILTITPSEATIIAADICTKAASIKLGFVDRFSGSVIIVGSTSNVESALNSVITTFYNKLGFDTVSITKT